METRSQQPIIPEGYVDLLGSPALAHIATIGPHGEPRNNPAWFGRDGEQIASPVGTRQEYRNLRGEVVHVDEDPNLDFINTMAKKYLGLDEYPYHRPGDQRVVLFVRPEHTTQMGA